MSHPRKGPRQRPAQPLDNLEIKEGRKEGGFETIKTGRAANRHASESLLRLSQGRLLHLIKASNYLRHCGTRLILRAFPDAANSAVQSAALNLAGGWYCKSRLCPTCARKKAKRRQHNAAKFTQLEQEALRGYHAYHLVLTLRHNAAEKVRTNFYLAELLRCWRRLRGRDHNRAQRAWWDCKTAGTIWSVEIIPARHDVTGHIHLHVLLFSKWGNLTRAMGAEKGRKRPRRSVFLQRLERDWQTFTQDSSQVHLEKVYERAETGEKRYYDPKKHDVEVLDRAVVEAMKYTMKANPQELEALGADFVTAMLTERRRHSGRTGIFSDKGKQSPFTHLAVLNAKYRDPEQEAERRKAELTEPLTGVLVPAEKTRLVVTPVSNVRWGVVAADHRYKERGEVLPPDREYYKLRQQKPAWVQSFGDTEEGRRDMRKFLYHGVGRGYSPKADVFEDAAQRREWEQQVAGAWRG